VPTTFKFRDNPKMFLINMCFFFFVIAYTIINSCSHERLREGSSRASVPPPGCYEKIKLEKEENYQILIPKITGLLKEKVFAYPEYSREIYKNSPKRF
jgi:hypothetical protein